MVVLSGGVRTGAFRGLGVSIAGLGSAEAEAEAEAVVSCLGPELECETM